MLLELQDLLLILIKASMDSKAIGGGCSNVLEQLDWHQNIKGLSILEGTYQGVECEKNMRQFGFAY